MLIQIVKGEPSPEEIAAVMAVLTARAKAAASAAAEEQPRFAHCGRQPSVRWQRFERRLGYRSPVSWSR